MRYAWIALIAVSNVFISRFSFAQESDGVAPTRERVRRPSADDATSSLPTIFDVRKSLAMEPDEPTYHDFYINAGQDVGIKKGQYLPVVRTVPVHDPIQNKQQGLLTIPIGKVQVIHVERNMAVARLANELNGDERPTVEFEAVMIGDRVDPKAASTEAPKTSKKPKRKAAAASIDPKPDTIVEATIEVVPSAPNPVPAIPAAVPAPAAPPAAAQGPATAPANEPPRVSQPVPAPNKVTAAG